MKIMVGQSFFGSQGLVAFAAEMKWMPGMLGIIMDLTFPILSEFLLAHWNSLEPGSNGGMDKAEDDDEAGSETG